MVWFTALELVLMEALIFLLVTCSYSFCTPVSKYSYIHATMFVCFAKLWQHRHFSFDKLSMKFFLNYVLYGAQTWSTYLLHKSLESEAFLGESFEGCPDPIANIPSSQPFIRHKNSHNLTMATKQPSLQYIHPPE